MKYNLWFSVTVNNRLVKSLKCIKISTSGRIQGLVFCILENLAPTRLDISCSISKGIKYFDALKHLTVTNLGLCIWFLVVAPQDL